MKTRLLLTVLLVAAVSLAGCKKEEPKPVTETPKVPTENTEPAGTMDTLKEAVSEKVSDFTKEIDLEKTVADLKAEAAEMSLDDLKAVAEKYKTAIADKSALIDKLMEKQKNIPLLEKTGDEAQKIIAELKELNEAVAPLKERFGVYLDAIKAKGGDISILKS